MRERGKRGREARKVRIGVKKEKKKVGGATKEVEPRGRGEGGA